MLLRILFGLPASSVLYKYSVSVFVCLFFFKKYFLCDKMTKRIFRNSC